MDGVEDFCLEIRFVCKDSKIGDGWGWRFLPRNKVCMQGLKNQFFLPKILFFLPNEIYFSFQAFLVWNHRYIVIFWDISRYFRYLTKFRVIRSIFSKPNNPINEIGFKNTWKMRNIAFKGIRTFVYEGKPMHLNHSCWIRI